ncbi:MAG: ABC transporter ATP-binding protein [Planctomycetes bacterium]|nr:ABC transporter ATP-binding protein [Planctomycetota bacterium]
MSSDTIIRAVGVAKRYRIHAGAPVSLHETLGHALRLRRPPRQWQEFWALRDLSLTIRRGEKVAFLGRNGAGKSTLLKLVCRITPPTSGYIDVEGRVASMLEVGTGFHPELSGRDNIFLNASILGLTRRQTLERFDRITAFADIGAFLDTPVKHFSSGMYVRLAFAVAAHTEPDILVIDEVLTVGDVAFREKCREHLTGHGQADRTMLMVSHELEHLVRVATRGVVLDQGQVCFDGPIADAIDHHRRLRPAEVARG